MLGVLRDGTGEALVALPGLSALTALVDGVREAGLPVELTCRPADALTDDRSPGRAPASRRTGSSRRRSPT